ncbi:TetR/AcrR family transcriptional regulator [Microbacterium stercoris]|uniref:TetR/AcrR family transcriptional regulator n=1 Tax=Microbacterium stercoris TaxID=2820289 RepID=A0A939TSG7_9MICO|nr:TetR/AcrR family transcriptional regulator [Microbacterium stercoris]MBO3665161.1 TetR/AcrR family transcriptional regulator [Microbacterium stercoris]
MASRDESSERQTRNSERTRAAVLSAAAEAMAERGTGVSLDHIAKRAGVSKGGLLHHFASREALIVALVDDAQQRLRENVLKHLDLSENTPGKLLRAYVRALTSGSEATVQYFTAAPTWAGIYQIPEVAAIAAADSRWWNENLAADGLSPAQILVVRRAAEGLAAAVAYGDETQAAVTEARALLLHLTNNDSFPAVGPAADSTAGPASTAAGDGDRAAERKPTP